MSPKRLGSVLRALRQGKGLSQRALAGRVGVTDAYIALIETGARKNPSLEVLKGLAKALGVPVTDLLGT
jgi:transcriptional regulator with XRE-family HTH domain